MKRLLLASALLGAVGAIGTANAAPITSATVTIWGADTPGNISTSPAQQGLPTATGAFGGPLPLLTSPGTAAYVQPINYNDTGNDTVGGFFTTAGNPVPGNCGAGCAGTVLSTGGFGHATEIEFSFTVASAGTLTVTHDDGISLFVAGQEPNGTNLIPGQSAPTTSQVGMATLSAGVTYDLWYNESNGLPAILQTDFVPSIAAPEPASLTLIGSALIGLGWLGWRRRKSA